jgi:hypothetical protein
MRWFESIKSAVSRIGAVAIYAAGIGCGLVLSGCAAPQAAAPVTYLQVRAVEAYLLPAALYPTAGWVGEVREERAFVTTSEQGGDVPAQIKDFGKDFCVTGMAISPDGQRIVYSETSFDTKALPPDLRDVRLDQDNFVPISGSNIRGLSTSGTGIEHITEENYKDLYPSFTQDGTQLLFCSNRRRSESDDILRTGASGRGGVADIYICPDPGARAIKPTQSADGTIAFALYPPSWRQPGDVQIYTQGPHQYPTQIALGVQPCISPNGKQIAYIGADGNLWVINVDGSNNIQLTTDAANIIQKIKASLSGPDQASELAQFNYFESQGEAQGEPGGLGNLLLYYMPYSYPSWSPGGKRILFTGKVPDSTGRPHDAIWIMDANADNTPQQLTTNGSQNRFPLMSPDQQFIYFLSNRGVTWSIWRISTSNLTPDPMAH